MIFMSINLSNAENFYKELYNYVKKHPATDNDFINRFSRGDITKDEFENFAIEFYHFTREWPSILALLLVNEPNESDAYNLTKILVSELGDDDPNKRHELLYRKFLRSINIQPSDLIFKQKLPSTQEWLDSMRRLFSSEHFTALGAEFGLENMAIPMWDKLLPGLEIIRKNWKGYEKMDIEYFTFHRELEIHHEEAMEDVLGEHKYDEKARINFFAGAKEILDYEERFWLGLAIR